MGVDWENRFPNLTDWVQTSDPTNDYNCVAHVLGDPTRWWDPLPPGHFYWPDNIGEDMGYAIERYIKLFEAQGYLRCKDGSLEPRKNKIALYANNYGMFEHVAKQLADGKWTSKIGTEEDITHDDPDSLSGPSYGKAAIFMEKIVDASSERPFA